MRKRITNIILLILLLNPLLYELESHAAASVYGSGEVQSEKQKLNFDDALLVSALREGMKNFSEAIHLHFNYTGQVLEDLPSLVDEWVARALEETGDPNEGDYLKYQTGGYEASFSYLEENGNYDYHVDIYPRYYLYIEQKLQAESEIRKVMEELGIAQLKTDHEKVRRIYDYICRNITYDKIHGKSDHYVLRSTVYAAIVQKTCTCQGYSVLMQRMFREAGIEGRIITGIGRHGDGEGLHSWNIVKLGSRYYLLDATWDAGSESYSWFLKGSRNFEGHFPDEAFTKKEFTNLYPISEHDYLEDPVHMIETVEEDIELEMGKRLSAVLELEHEIETELEKDVPLIIRHEEQRIEEELESVFPAE